MDPELKKLLDAQDEKISAIYRSVEQTRRYFKWTMIITIVVIVLPLIASVFIVPVVIQQYSSLFSLPL